MKRFLIVLLALFFLSSIPIQAQAGVVPCGLSQDDPDQPGDQTVPCQFCHFFVLFKNVIEFFLFTIVPPVAILMLAIGGFMYMFSYLNPEGTLGGAGGPALISKANSLFKSVIFGLLIIFGAWIIVSAFFTAIGVADWTGLREGWWKIDCPIR